MARKKTLGAPQREVVWLSHASRARMSLGQGGLTVEGLDGQDQFVESDYPDDADCPSSYSYPITSDVPVTDSRPHRASRHRRALVLNLLGFRLVLMRNSAPHAA